MWICCFLSWVCVCSSLRSAGDVKTAVGPRKGDGEGILSGQKGAEDFLAAFWMMLFFVDVFLIPHFCPPASAGSEQVQGSFGDQVLPSESCSVEQKSIAKQRAQIVIYINFSIGTSWLLTCKSKDFNRRKIKPIFHFRIQPATTTFFFFFYFWFCFWSPDLVLWTKRTDSEGAALHAVVLHHPNLCVKLNKIWMLNISFYDHLSFCGK